MNGLLVFIGGGLGALVRYILYLILPKAAYFPLSTLIANFFGCFVATMVFMYFISKSDAENAFKTFLIVGFCGGLSTLSALSLELFEYIQNSEYIRAFAYCTVSILVCAVAVILAAIIIKHCAI